MVTIAFPSSCSHILFRPLQACPQMLDKLQTSQGLIQNFSLSIVSLSLDAPFLQIRVSFLQGLLWTWHFGQDLGRAHRVNTQTKHKTKKRRQARIQHISCSGHVHSHTLYWYLRPYGAQVMVCGCLLSLGSNNWLACKLWQREWPTIVYDRTRWHRVCKPLLSPSFFPLFSCSLSCSFFLLPLLLLLICAFSRNISPAPWARASKAPRPS